MKIETSSLPGVLMLRPTRVGDDRGWFSETFRRDKLLEAGVDVDFVQDNQSFSAQKGTIRGLHFQVAPFAQAKLVRVVAGAILDVVVDLRGGSPTYGRHLAVRLDAVTGDQIYLPVGFAHGFCTLEPDTMIAYKVSAHYSREHDRSLLWNDPALAINWPVPPEEATLSDKDMAAPRLSELDRPFD